EWTRVVVFCFFFQAEDGIRDFHVTGVQTCALPISSFPMYYDHGMRGYLNIRWRITRQLDLWTRYALTQYFDRETVGSGLDEIMGSKRSEIKFQIRWQW